MLPAIIPAPAYKKLSGGKTALLIHFDGTNNSTVFTDSSTYTHNLSRRGSGSYASRISTAIKKFGTGSYYHNVAGQCGGYVTNPHPDLQLGTRDFCVDMWVYLITSIVANGFFSTNDIGSYRLGSLSIGNTSDKRFLCTIGNGNPQTQIDLLFPDRPVMPISGNQFFHLALTRAGNIFRVFVNGTLLDQVTSSINITSSSSIGPLFCSRTGNDGGSMRLDEFRLVVDSPVWTSNFTPPTEPYTGLEIV